MWSSVFASIYLYASRFAIVLPKQLNLETIHVAEIIRNSIPVWKCKMYGRFNCIEKCNEAGRMIHIVILLTLCLLFERSADVAAAENAGSIRKLGRCSAVIDGAVYNLESLQTKSEQPRWVGEFRVRFCGGGGQIGAGWLPAWIPEIGFILISRDAIFFKIQKILKTFGHDCHLVAPHARDFLLTWYYVNFWQTVDTRYIWYKFRLRMGHWSLMATCPGPLRLWGVYLFSRAWRVMSSKRQCSICREGG